MWDPPISAVLSKATSSSRWPAATIEGSSLLMSASSGRPRLAVMCRPSASAVRRAVPLSKVSGSMRGNSIKSKPAARARWTELAMPRVSNSPVNTSAWQPIIDGIPTQPPAIRLRRNVAAQTRSAALQRPAARRARATGTAGRRYLQTPAGCRRSSTQSAPWRARSRTLARCRP